jgi:hypothetical protein
VTNPQHVFISYARKDGRDYAARVDADLIASGFHTWRDTRDIDPNQDFSAELERAIANSSYVVCCITPDTRRDESFVRREIGYALAVKKPVVPLIFENTLPPIHIINVTRINAMIQQWDRTITELVARLQHTDDHTYDQVTLPPDPYRDYLTSLYEEIVRYLNLTVFSLITLHGESSPDAIEKPSTNVLPMAFFDMAGINAKIDDKTRFNNFQEAFEKYQGRILLLGEPGGGKTTTLFAFARDAVAARLQNPSLPLPILAPIATWDAKTQTPLADWLSGQIPLLKHDDLARMIDSGEALLLLDGLDELGGEREDETTHQRYDPRLRFIEQISSSVGTQRGISVPFTHIATSCRVQDYTDIGTKLLLQGAVTLQPLNDAQMHDYLSDLPDLWVALEADNGLREIARTPLLLSLFTFAFRDLPHEAQQLRDLKGGDVRDKIFETYVRRRYEREELKLYSQLPFTLNKIYEVLGYTAMENTGKWMKRENVFHYQEFSLLSNEEELKAFVKLVQQLNLIVPYEKDTFRFIHILLRDYFAFNKSMEILRIGKISYLRKSAAYSLGSINDKRAIQRLIAAYVLEDFPSVRREIILSLGKIGDERGIHTLKVALYDSNMAVRLGASYALEHIGTPEALAAVETWRKSQRGSQS